MESSEETIFVLSRQKVHGETHSNNAVVMDYTAVWFVDHIVAYHSHLWNLCD